MKINDAVTPSSRPFPHFSGERLSCWRRRLRSGASSSSSRRRLPLLLLLSLLHLPSELLARFRFPFVRGTRYSSRVVDGCVEDHCFLFCLQVTSNDLIVFASQQARATQWLAPQKQFSRPGECGRLENRFSTDRRVTRQAPALYVTQMVHCEKGRVQ